MTGHIGKRQRTTKDGKVHTFWFAQVYLGRHAATGKPQFISKTFERKGEADDWAAKQVTAKANGETPSTTKLTLAAWLEEWLTGHDVRDVTIYNYRATLNRWILNPTNGAPPIGSLALSKLSVGAFDKLYRYMSKQGVRPRGVSNLHQIVRPALKAAVKKGYLSRNPVEHATVPKINAKGDEEVEDAAEARAMSNEEADRFLAAAKENRHSALWHVLLMGGLRPCEAFALKWEHVDFENGRVHVRKSLTRLGLDRKKHPLGWKLTGPKTPKSKRDVPLPNVAMEQLRAWKTQQKRERLQLGPEWQEHGFVFTTEIGTPLDLSNLYRGAFRRVCEKAGLGEYGPESKKPRSGPTRKRPFTPSHRIYDLRHTHATQLLMDGEDLLVVSRRLGHSTIKLTADTYASVTKERSEGVANRLDRMFASE